MISVIVPYWNSEKWICRCVKSLKLNKGDFEFIMVNDHSDDDGEAVGRAAAEGDNRFCFIDNKGRRGPSGARNTGIRAAEGEWITFLDADDEMLPNAYKIFIRVIKADERANVHQMNHLRYYTAIDKLALKYTNERGIYSSVNLPDMWFGVWNKLYRRSFIKENRIEFNESLFYGEDGLFVLECLAKDDYIHHASRNVTAVKHRFDNKQSLSHIKTLDDLITYIHKLEAFALRTDNKAVALAGCRILAENWTSPRLSEALMEK